MSWTTIIWSAGSGVCVGLAGIHLLVWMKSRKSWANLFFAVAALMAAFATQCELLMMHTATPEANGYWHRVLHIPVGVLIVALGWFVYFYLRAGRLWLLWTVVGMRAVVLIVNFLVRPNVNFYEISGLHQLQVWGETLVVPIGTHRPWIYLIDGASLLFLVFVVDASITVWRRGQHRLGATVGGTIAVAVVLGITMSQLHDRGLLAMPFTVGLLFLIIVLGMSYELSMDLARAGQLSVDLQRSQERMNMAANSANLSVWEWNVAQGDIWSTDQGRARLGAGPEEQLTIDRVLRALHADDRQPMRAAIERALANGDELEIECRIVVPDGTTRWFAVRGKAEKDEQAVWMRGVSLDITDRKRAEAAAAEREAELEHAARVGSLGELSSTLAHELNQPLTAILSNAQAARRMVASNTGNPEELEEILDDIVSDDKRAGEIIHRMKDLIVSGAHTRQRIDVGDSIRGVAQLLHSRLVEVEVSLSLHLPADLPAVEADPIGVQQVILNLMMNAIEAMSQTDASARQLTVAAHREDNMVVVSVRDTGPGIEPERAGLIFSPFHTTKSGGLGLGLAICRRIAETHGGKLWLENCTEPGARICFALPVGEAQP